MWIIPVIAGGNTDGRSNKKEFYITSKIYIYISNIERSVVLSRSNSEDPVDIEQKLVLCVQLLGCVYICSVPIQHCVYLLTTGACTLFTQHRKEVCKFAEYSCVYTCLGVHGRTVAWKSTKLAARTCPRHRFMATMEPGTREIKFFDTKLQILESLNLSTKNHRFSNHETKS